MFSGFLKRQFQPGPTVVRVQRLATKLITAGSIYDLENKQRLKLLRLPLSTECRRGHLIQTYKIFSDTDDLTLHNL